MCKSKSLLRARNSSARWHGSWRCYSGGCKWKLSGCSEEERFQRGIPCLSHDWSCTKGQKKLRNLEGWRSFSLKVYFAIQVWIPTVAFSSVLKVHQKSWTMSFKSINVCPINLLLISSFMESCKLSCDSCSTKAVFTLLTFFKSLGTNLFRQQNLLIHQVNIFVKFLTVPILD